MSLTTETSITLCTTAPPQWADELLQYLSKQGYQLNSIEHLGEDPGVLSHTTLPDAIITTNAADGLLVAKFFEDSAALAIRPLIILVSEITDTINQPDWADIVLPPSPPYISQQLERLLHLQHENTRLVAENTRLKEQLARHEHLNKEIEILKNAIVRNVSHELKTPLLQVKSAVALLAEDIENEELINYAKGATARLETLVKNITLLGSSLDYNPSPVIVRDAVAYAKRNLRRIWEHRDTGDRIQIEVEPDLPPIMADKQGISTVLQLLIDNALKFSEDNTEVRVTANRIEQEIEIAVIDQGIGIPQDDIKAIFQMFVQLDSSSTRRYGGTGIGLAIVQLILDNHQTQIRVTSEVGKGSIFAFRLPIVEL